MSTSEPYDLLIRGATVLTADAARPQIDDALIGIRGQRKVRGIDAPGTGSAPRSRAAR